MSEVLAADSLDRCLSTCEEMANDSTQSRTRHEPSGKLVPEVTRALFSATLVALTVFR